MKCVKSSAYPAKLGAGGDNKGPWESGSEHEKCPLPSSPPWPLLACLLQRGGGREKERGRGVGDLPHSNLGRQEGGGLMEWMTPAH